MAEGNSSDGSGASSEGPASATEAAEPSPEEEEALREEFEQLRVRIFSDSATVDEMQRFWELARTTGAVDELIQQFAKQVEEAPEGIEARMRLAEAYVAKLLCVPDGPERGAWAMKAEHQWQEVLKADPNHWDARFSLALSWSQWPDYMNKTPDAIRELEKLREVQQRVASEPGHARTYLQLSILYRKQGKHDKARAVLQEGLGWHPGNEELQKALEAAE